ncbi:metal-sensitive transcriptional repressor [Leptospira perolatii]|uniref:Metal-sensitive transcriptional repressor n=1 Tax=Leptospira perolatii TaxID=2023191 RepID=A0A2M9ZNE3_9LEPT|nr:metal-sensitive transcriptional regulator [Leptospira perolatii]PJZ69609.1 metal-sensitive transcriptional repressor [Leptospira perolatii]PJZ73596.1 metal-sensitive transcriptional repressor [Leptospira perolatii]
MKSEDSKKKLINRIHRIKGQLDAIEKGLLSDSADCEKTLLLLKASNQALKKFGEAYVQEFLGNCIASRKNQNLLETNLRKAIKAAFTL